MLHLYRNIRNLLNKNYAALALMTTAILQYKKYYI